jgi:hypothetical protein
LANIILTHYIHSFLTPFGVSFGSTSFVGSSKRYSRTSHPIIPTMTRQTLIMSALLRPIIRSCQCRSYGVLRFEEYFASWNRTWLRKIVDRLCYSSIVWTRMSLHPDAALSSSPSPLRSRSLT